MKKVALITGITGQDGAYLAKFLLDKHYDVHGTTRQEEVNDWRLIQLGIEKQVTLHVCPLDSYQTVYDTLITINPDEVYHLAAQSCVSESLKDPVTTIQFNISSTQNLLEAIRNSKLPTKFFHASSSEIFDPEAKSPLTTLSPIKPIHPYGLAKAACHFLTQVYKNNYGLYAVNGILFPHESPLRDRGTLLKMFVSQAQAIKNGQADDFFIAAPDNIRDFGDARSYIEAMWLSLQAESADDYIICSGNPVSIKTIADFILSQYSLDESCIKINNSLVRQPNIPTIFGDPSETKQKLGWSNTIPLLETIQTIIELQDRADHEA